MNEAPLFVQAYDLVKWLLNHFGPGTRYPTLSQAILREADGVMCAVTLALKQLEPRAQALEADRQLVRLRVHLRLASELEMLSTEQYEHTSRIVDEIGRQLGGWRKRLDRL